jgi:hypothetical protein
VALLSAVDTGAVSQLKPLLASTVKESEAEAALPACASGAASASVSVSVSASVGDREGASGAMTWEETSFMDEPFTASVEQQG